MIFFFFLNENICCGYSSEAPHWGASNEYHNICFCWEIRKISAFFGWRKCHICCFGYLDTPLIWSSIFLKNRHFIIQERFNPLQTEWTLPHYILEDSNLKFRYVRLCNLNIPRKKWLNYLQTVETLIRCHILRHLFGVCTVCQLLFYGSPDYNGLINWYMVLIQS